MKRIALASMLAAAALVLGGCLVPPVMLAADVVAAAVKAQVEHAENNRPTAEEMWVQGLVERLESRAESGDAESAFRLGTYYEQARQPEAQRWICRAANRGHARAQAQMGHWYNEDREGEDLWPFVSLRPDNRAAFMWYSLAIENGEHNARLFRDQILHHAMSPAQVEEARALVGAWSPGSCGWTAAASEPADR